ncbi:golgi-localized gamma-adaptin ear containing arf binding protein [Holotrichia oblita]|uniref:Golgi-localized gamma-adaptin ear containing arf binding protein n=1 Tax=Holotrichia oblita TaxID=644536 RepID=A0ACB9T5R8_HOLOL|nr:golgi-localized gamma-adaptin ear containing arf binding protein [Holotrichia oblita]
MDVVTTSLDALLQRATNPQNQNVDKAAVEAFYVLVNKEKDGSHIGVKLIALRLHSKQEKEVLQTLNILDTCMQKCGSNFQSEVGKFRFLNEMIKLVSPKYLGSQTPLSVRQKVLQLMYLWTLDYPKESKIKEAYDMLKKQGVIMETPFNVNSETYLSDKAKNSIFCDEEKSKLLQKLLQSKNPEDLQAANRLIKCMVKEDDKRAELKSRRVLELESVHSNVRLLSEMLDTYVKDGSSHDEMELIRELYQSCERLRPTVLKLASETQQNEDILPDILNASDELGKVFDKYKDIIINGKRYKHVEREENLSLLDFGSSKPGTPVLLDEAKVTACDNKNSSEFDVLCDIFTAPNTEESLLDGDNTILKPVSLVKADQVESPKQNGKLKALEELDALGESLLKQNLQSISRQGPKFQKNAEKVPMNKLPIVQNDFKQPSNNPTQIIPILNNNNTPAALSSAVNFDLSYLLEKTKANDDTKLVKIPDRNGDDLLVDITEDKHDIIEKSDLPENTNKVGDIQEAKTMVKLSDLYVELDSIKPSSIPPVVALEEKNGISVTLHFARDKPREDINVIVVTIVSKNELPLKNILFRAIVPKSCKVKLQAPSAIELPPFNPFLPPSAITQVMLIANPENVKVSLKFIVSYNVDDETTTEMGEIDCLPTIS